MPTEADPTTPAQARVIEYCHKYADWKGTRLRAVIFEENAHPIVMDGKVTGTAAAYALSDSDTIVFWKPYIERDYVWDLIPAYAAHEVCHLYYGDTDESERIEARANACAEEILRRTSN